MYLFLSGKCQTVKSKIQFAWRCRKDRHDSVCLREALLLFPSFCPFCTYFPQIWVPGQVILAVLVWGWPGNLLTELRLRNIWPACWGTNGISVDMLIFYGRASIPQSMTVLVLCLSQQERLAENRRPVRVRRSHRIPMIPWLQ